jgi:SAM-dependent methyltransferase
MWRVDQYRKTSPAYHRFFDEVKAIVSPDDYVIEFGCGTGVGLAEIAKTNEVLGIDIADGCLSVDVPFLQACIWEPMHVTGDVGFCVDVMEHLPTDKVVDAIHEIMRCVPKCLFIACKKDDYLGPRHIGKELHLTLKGDDWWIEQAGKIGRVTWWASDVRAVHFILERD